MNLPRYSERRRESPGAVKKAPPIAAGRRATSAPLFRRSRPASLQMKKKPPRIGVSFLFSPFSIFPRQKSTELRKVFPSFGSFFSLRRSHFEDLLKLQTSSHDWFDNIGKRTKEESLGTLPSSGLRFQSTLPRLLLKTLIRPSPNLLSIWKILQSKAAAVKARRCGTRMLGGGTRRQHVTEVNILGNVPEVGKLQTSARLIARMSVYPLITACTIIVNVRILEVEISA